MCTVPVLNRFCKESYNEPRALYDLLKSRGMDLVTVTDHDSIDAAEELRQHNDFFLSEEVSCILPSRTALHVGVYGITEAHHSELQRRRSDMPAFLAYLGEQRLFFSVNHVFSSLTGARRDGDFELFKSGFPGLEILNGQMPKDSNAAATALAQRWRKAPVAGSDAHTGFSLGLTYTDIPGAKNAEEYLEMLALGRGVARGRSGDFQTLTRTVLEIGWCLINEKHWAALLAPLFLAVPAVTLAHYAKENAFGRRWAKRVLTAETEPVALEQYEPVESTS